MLKRTGAPACTWLLVLLYVIYILNKTATYGSEFTAARIVIDQIIEHCTMLHHLGVLVTKKTYMSGDNKSVVDSSSVLQSKLHKQHTALSYH